MNRVSKEFQMIKKVNTAILFLAFLLQVQGIYGQNPANITDHLRAKFTTYLTAVPRQEIYMHTDREEFISGEDFWFNIYTYDRQSFRLSEDSKIAYVELLNKANRPIIQKKIWLDKGIGAGQIILPDTLSTGIYTVRAYTNWMKNFLPYNCFVQDIKIYNAFSNKVVKEKLVSGKRINDGTNTQFYKEGLSLALNKNGQDGFDLIVNADEKYRTENGNIFYLFIETHGNVDRVSSERITGENTLIPVSGRQLNSGINHITLFNSTGKPVCERFSYSSQKDNPVPAINCADSLLIREKLLMNINSPQELNSSIFSISVAPLTDNHSVMDFGDYMVFGTEFGFLPGSIIKNQKISDLDPSIMDSLLVNVSSNWINWNAILADEVPLFMYQMENEVNYLTGKLLTAQKEADPGKFVLLSIPGKNAFQPAYRLDKRSHLSPGRHIYLR
jgi:hypothetical protein